MNTVIKSTLGRVVTTLVVVAMILSLTFVFAAPANALTEDQITSILGLLSSFGADQSTIDNVNASLRGQASPGTGTPSTPSSSSVCPYTWTTSRTTGDSGDDVMKLQKFLNSDSATMIASSGVGSAGSETNYFGALTASAVAKFQNKYASQVLTPVGLTSGTGYFGASTRAHMNSLCTVATTPGTPTTPSVGTGLGVSGTTQPFDTLAVENASRLPFTKFVVTAGTDGDVVMDSVTVERRGLSANTAISGIILIDDSGTQYGLAKTLNSNNQARVGAKVTIPAGTSKTFTIAGNMPAINDARAGEVMVLAVIGINTSATVTGSLPITGAAHVINATLAIGSATAARGALDPNASSDKEVGTTGHTFAAIKITAGSAEDIRLHSVRFNQSGSATASDLDNIVIIAAGVTYNAVASTDGKYYSANFPGGIVIAEGLTKEISIKGDIVSGSQRTVIFDIYQNTDVYVTGETFGYGITPSPDTTTSATDASSQFTDGTPWFDGAAVTVGTGSLTVSSTNDVAAGNIADGSSSVALGSFKFDVKGEEVSFTALTLSLTVATSGSGVALTNLTLVDGNGSVIAGPQDATFTTATAGTVAFSDTVTFPVGVHTVIVKGTLDNDWSADDTIVLSFNPATAITTLTGATSGQTLTATPSATVTAKTQTVSSASLTVTPASSFVARSIINNSNEVVVGRYVLDATASGEDLRITTVQFEATTGAQADADDYNTMQLFDGSTALNTGSNILSPSGNADADTPVLTITLDSPGLTIPKGTSKVVELKANVNDAAIGGAPTMIFDFSGLSSSWTVTGLTTGTDVAETLASSVAGAQLTVVASGTLTATVASSDPTEKWYVAGSTATVGVFKFTGTNEAQAVTDLSLVLGTASSSSADIQSVSLWDGGTMLLQKVSPFVSSNIEAFDLPSSGAGSFIVPVNDDKNLTVKVTFANIGTSLAGNSGQWIKLATTTVAANHKALGTDSGTSANILGDAGTTTGAKYFRSLPTLAHVSQENTLANGTRELYRFTVSADDADDIAIQSFNFTYSTTSADTASWKLTEMESGKIVRTGVANSGAEGAGSLDISVNSSTYGAGFITIPKGDTYTYKLEATVTNAATAGDSIEVYLTTDSAALSTATGVEMETASNADSDTNGNFVWSPISDGSASLTDVDWMNGYKVPGIEVDNLASEVTSI